MRSPKKKVINFNILKPKPATPLEKFHGKVLDSTYSSTTAYLQRDGKPYICRMGEIHYSRVKESCWEQELIKMKNGGIDVISSYVFWIHHEEIEGDVRFDGNLNIKKFLSLCKKNSLPFVLRLGPWVHGEAKNGGFPDWLKARTNGKLRTNDKTYLSYVRRFFEKIYDEIKDYTDVILAVQIENELRLSLDYAQELLEMISDIGFNPPYFTFTGWGGSDSIESCPAGKVLCLYGGYPEAPWTQNVDPIYFNPNFSFSAERDDANIGADIMKNECRTDDENEKATLIKNTPYLTCEMGGGNQITYHRRPIISKEDICAITISKLGSGANGLGYYMYHGGKNPMGRTTTMQESRISKYPNDLPIISYDFQAPIGEAGQIRDSYYSLKKIHNFIELCGEKLATMPPYFEENPIATSLSKNTICASVRSDGERGYVFINNHARLTKLPDVNVSFNIKLPTAKSIIFDISVSCDACGIIPFNFDIGGENICYLTALPQYYDGDILHLSKNAGIKPIISKNGNKAEEITSGMKIGNVTLVLDDDFTNPNLKFKNIDISPCNIAAEKDFYSHIINFDKTKPCFDKINSYTFLLPANAKFIKIQAMGNIGALYLDDALISDYYLYGVDWIVDVRDVPKGKELLLCILPLTSKNKEKIYFECDMPIGEFTPKIFVCFDEEI